MGVLITLTLDWIPQVERMVGIVQDKGDRLIYKAKPAGASPRQLLNLIQTAIKPSAIYTMAVATYRPHDLARLDRAIATITKKCTNLAISTSSAAIHLPVDEAGMGITSLLVDYLQIQHPPSSGASTTPGNWEPPLRHSCTSNAKCWGTSRPTSSQQQPHATAQ